MPMMDASQVLPAHLMPEIIVKVKTQYIQNQSLPDEDKYVFAYHVDIYNPSHHTVQLLTRNWLITDGNGKMQEVQGDGVVGNTPILTPGESFQYSSGAVLNTQVGSMSGHYGMRVILTAEDKAENEAEGTAEQSGLMFKADIPVFTLAIPSALN